MTIEGTPIAPPEAGQVDEAPARSAGHLGASPRPRHYHGRHRRSRNAER